MRGPTHPSRPPRLRGQRPRLPFPSCPDELGAFLMTVRIPETHREDGKLASMTILLAGCGDLGTEAGLRFAAAGHRVVGWRRSPDKLPAEIEGVAANLSTAGL